MNNVVDLAAAGVSVAAGVGAATVTGGDGFALREGHTPFLPAHIHRLTIPAEDDGGDLRVAEDPAQLGGGGVPAELQLRTPGLSPHGLEVEDRRDVRPLATLGRQIPVVEDTFTD